jgi:hypothetical protein
VRDLGQPLRDAQTLRRLSQNSEYGRRGAQRDECSRNRQGRLIEICPYDTAVVWQRANQRDPQKQKLLKKRKVIVQPIFGVIKQAWGFRRWTLLGLENVRTQWSMLCAAFNLQKMYKVWAAGELALA